MDKFDRALPHITAWEFVALGVNIIVFGAALAGQRVVLLADALASVQVMVNRAAHSPVMQIIHRLILALPEVGALGANLLEEHVFGELNVLADAASRARRELIQTIATQMGLMARELPLPVRALKFIAQLSGKSAVARTEPHGSLGNYSRTRSESPPLLVPRGPRLQLSGRSADAKAEPLNRGSYPCTRSESPPLLVPRAPLPAFSYPVNQCLALALNHHPALNRTLLDACFLNNHWNLRLCPKRVVGAPFTQGLSKFRPSAPGEQSML